MTTRFLPAEWRDYALLDSGHGKRLERFGDLTLVRPDPFALWKPSGDPTLGPGPTPHSSPQAAPTASGAPPGTPTRWPLRYRSDALDLTFGLEMTKFKHVGLFPEQADNWEFLAANLKPGDKFLNLFAYTGGHSPRAKWAPTSSTATPSGKSWIGRVPTWSEVAWTASAGWWRTP